MKINRVVHVFMNVHTLLKEVFTRGGGNPLKESMLIQKAKKSLRTGSNFWGKISSKMLFKGFTSFFTWKFKCVIKSIPFESEAKFSQKIWNSFVWNRFS